MNSWVVNEWIVLGVGNLFFDIMDAIESNEDKITTVVLNHQIEVDLKPYSHRIKIIKLEEFNSKEKLFDNECCVFGFLNPHKMEFMDSIKLELRKFGNVIHKKAYRSPICYQLSLGNYFGPNVTIAPNVGIQGFNYFNRNCSIGHNTQIDSFNHIGPGATVCGRCEIGSRNYIGAGSVIKDGVRIWHDITIGAGAVVTSDIKEPGTYIGVPAKKLDKPSQPHSLFRCPSF